MKYFKNIFIKSLFLLLGIFAATIIVSHHKDLSEGVLEKPLSQGILASGRGYGGDMRFLIRTGEEGKIVGVSLVDHHETPDVVTYLEGKGFFNVWNGLTFKEAAAKKVDAVSSATETTQAIIDGLQKELSQVSAIQIQKVKRKPNPIKLALSLGVVLFALLSFFHSKIFSRYRFWLLLSSVMVLGLLSKEMLSLNQFLNWLLFGPNGFSVLVLIFGLSGITAFFMNRGFYCEYVCPYGALQEIVARGRKRKFSISQTVRKLFDWIGWSYFWLIVVALLAGFPLWLESFEPFAAFLFKGAALASVGIACLFLACSFFIPRLWCASFCPTGKIFNILKGVSPKNTWTKYLKFLVVFFLLLVFWIPRTQPKILGKKPSAGTSVRTVKPEEVRFKPALFWESLADNAVGCLLCPRHCQLKDGETGFCRARKNINGTLYALTYGQPVALHTDPIEKKPLNHVYPGTPSFSIATAGCNLRCKFCQNWEISQMDAEDVNAAFVSPVEIVAQAKAAGVKTIAFTYTEPTIFYEYMLDIAKAAKAEGIACVMHSAGYIEEKPLRELAPYLKAANIDVKGFNEKFYTTFTQGSLAVTLRTLKVLKEEGVWVEITNLLIPSANDSEDEVRKLCRWVKENLGAETPIHFSRFYPLYKLANLSPTPISSLMMAQRVAEEEGLQFIYLGNIPKQTGEQTLCPSCGKTLLKRIGYQLLENNIVGGKCSFCGYQVPGVWK